MWGCNISYQPQCLHFLLLMLHIKNIQIWSKSAGFYCLKVTGKLSHYLLIKPRIPYRIYFLQFSAVDEFYTLNVEAEIKVAYCRREIVQLSLL